MCIELLPAGGYPTAVNKHIIIIIIIIIIIGGGGVIRTCNYDFIYCMYLCVTY
jgi:hypothetical protein